MGIHSYITNCKNPQFWSSIHIFVFQFFPSTPSIHISFFIFCSVKLIHSYIIFLMHAGQTHQFMYHFLNFPINSYTKSKFWIFWVYKIEFLDFLGIYSYITKSKFWIFGHPFIYHKFPN